ncbi:hypothetical protein XENOCAPTIV_025087, partial [Xenoophorus captivus]
SDFQSALKIHNAVASCMHQPSPPFPQTQQAQPLAMEVTHPHSSLRFIHVNVSVLRRSQMSSE